MALKETLKMLQEREQAEKRFLEDRPKMIEEWKQAVASLFVEMRNFLAEYEQDGSLSFAEESIRLTEENLGSYSVPVMRIAAGPALILVQPVGRLVIGAMGRVDMHREGRAGERQRVMLLRIQKSATDPMLTWHVRIPSDIAPTFGVQLKKETLEQAIDFLLR